MSLIGIGGGSQAGNLQAQSGQAGTAFSISKGPYTGGYGGTGPLAIGPGNLATSASTYLTPQQLQELQEAYDKIASMTGTSIQFPVPPTTEELAELEALEAYRQKDMKQQQVEAFKKVAAPIRQRLVDDILWAREIQGIEAATDVAKSPRQLELESKKSISGGLYGTGSTVGQWIGGSITATIPQPWYAQPQYGPKTYLPSLMTEEDVIQAHNDATMAEMSKPRLSPEELHSIRQNEKEVEHLLKTLEAARRFNIGDYLIRYMGQDTAPELNSYFVERRFQVIYVDNNGISYVKEMMGGKASSWIMALAGVRGSIEEAFSGDNYEYRYALDPLYEDHILMQQEGKYDPTSLQKDKSKVFKEITSYNKSIKVKNARGHDALKFLKTVKVGDTLWFSSVTSFLIQEIKTIPRAANMDHNSYYDPVLVGVTNKGKNLKLSISDITRKAVYTACPRSYKELKTK